MKSYQAIIIVFFVQLLISTSTFSDNSPNLRNDLNTMSAILKNNCTNVEKYNPYKNTIKALNTYDDIRNIPDYTFNGIFGAMFLKFIKDDNCKNHSIQYIIKGVGWLNSNKIITKEDNFWSIIQRTLAKALVSKFYETGDEKLLDQAIAILKNDYLERYSKSEYLTLTNTQKRDLVESGKPGEYAYYDPNSYYLASMTFVPPITLDVKPEFLKILFLKTQAFENELIDSIILPFDNVESATLRVLNRLLYSHSKNEKLNKLWSDKSKSHINSLLARNFINQDSCNQIKKFHRSAQIGKSNYTKDLLQWVNGFVKTNCTNIKPLDEFISSILKRFPNHMLEQGKLKNEILRHAANDMWKYASDYKNKDFCDEMERVAKANNNVISELVNSKKYWNALKSKNCL